MIKEKISPEQSKIPLETPDQETPPSPPPYPESLKRIFRNRQNLEWEMGAGFHRGPGRRRRGYQLSLWSLVASTIDALLLVAMACVFMMVFVKIIKVPITQALVTDFAVIFVLSSWLYMITTRFFIGSSIGEAACDMRLGRPQERLSGSYFFRVIVRATLILLTGVVTLPLLSLIFGKDVPGVISGLRLFSLK